MGVPGADGKGLGDPAACDTESAICERAPNSGAAGVFEDMRRGGRSILDILLILSGANENCPSFVHRLLMCIDRSDDCVARNSLRGSHATP